MEEIQFFHSLLRCHLAALLNYVNENWRNLHKQTQKTLRSGSQADNFIEEELTIPPVATPLNAHQRVAHSASGRKLRPASALSWNDKDLIFLQQRKVRYLITVVSLIIAFRLVLCNLISKSGRVLSC